MTTEPQHIPRSDSEPEERDSLLQSSAPPTPDQMEAPKAPPPGSPQSADDPREAIAMLRQKMEMVATEFAEGKINRAQFNAMYGRYSEQRAIIERIIERNPESKAWKQVIGTTGHTSFLRHHFEAEPLYFLVYRHKLPEPLMIGGKTPPDMRQITPIIKALWAVPDRPKTGLARRNLGDNHWLILALGENALTVVVYQMEPAVTHAALVRDTHADFETANQAALTRQIIHADRLVFPQRALVEGDR